MNDFSFRSSDASDAFHYKRKIGPQAASRHPPQTASLDTTLAPSDLALTEWAELELPQPDWQTIREYRLGRVRHWLRQFDYAGIVLYDPINIRYATDTANMQVWCLHNDVRYCFIPTEGPIILFEFYHCDHISQHLPLVDELRPIQLWSYMATGRRGEQEHVQAWAAEIADLVHTHGGGNRRLAIDRTHIAGAAALQALGVELFNGEEVMELARLIKHDEEIKAMRCSMAAVEQSIAVMREHLQPGVSEMRLWSYLHAENIARGGEWIETRLLTSGERTNPWYQECSKRIIQEGDLVAFDTDAIGPYGICVDISRTWLCGDVAPTPQQRNLYQMAYEQIQHNQSLLKAGVSFRDLSERSKRYPWDTYNTYTLLYHGVGLCDEYPAIFFPEHWEQFGCKGVLEANMVMCVESYIGRIDGGEGVKLEEQILITENGYEVLSSYPFEENLLDRMF